MKPRAPDHISACYNISLVIWAVTSKEEPKPGEVKGEKVNSETAAPG